MRSSLYGGLVFVAILSVGLVALGCGGGEDHLTKAEFLQQGNAVCKKGNDQIDKAGKQLFGNKKKPSKADLNKFANDTLIPVVQTEIDGIGDLNPPSADEDQVNAIVDEAEAALDKGKADTTLLTSNKSDPFKKANKLANDYGLTECGG